MTAEITDLQLSNENTLNIKCNGVIYLNNGLELQPRERQITEYLKRWTVRHSDIYIYIYSFFHINMLSKLFSESVSSIEGDDEKKTTILSIVRNDAYVKRRV